MVSIFIVYIIQVIWETFWLHVQKQLPKQISMTTALSVSFSNHDVEFHFVFSRVDSLLRQAYLIGDTVIAWWQCFTRVFA